MLKLMDEPTLAGFDTGWSSEQLVVNKAAAANTNWAAASFKCFISFTVCFLGSSVFAVLCVAVESRVPFGCVF